MALEALVEGARLLSLRAMGLQLQVPLERGASRLLLVGGEMESGQQHLDLCILGVELEHLGSGRACSAGSVAVLRLV